MKKRIPKVGHYYIKKDSYKDRIYRVDEVILSKEGFMDLKVTQIFPSQFDVTPNYYGYLLGIHTWIFEDKEVKSKKIFERIMVEEL